MEQLNTTRLAKIWSTVVQCLGMWNTWAHNHFFFLQIELENIFFPSPQVQEEEKWSKLGERA